MVCAWLDIAGSTGGDDGDGGEDAGGKGKKMPPGGLLDADDLAVVEQWIVGGAEP